MKRVGIITLHCSYNYGSVLQAYALQSIIAKLGEYDVKIINYRNTVNYRGYYLFRTHLYRKFPQAFIADILYFAPNLKRRNNFLRFQRSYLKLTKDLFCETDSLNVLNNFFNVFVSGSDQIWNDKCFGGQFDPNFCLNFVDKENKRVAYAPSFGTSGFKQSEKEKFCKYLEKYECLSVREQPTYDVLQQILPSKDISLVLDPVLLAGADTFQQFIGKSKDRKFTNYIFVYLLGHKKHAKRLITTVCKISKETKLDIIYISYHRIRAFKKGKWKYGAAPDEFISLICNAKYIITDSFHATAFSVLYHKNFSVFPPNGNDDVRIKPFLNEISLSKCINSADIINISDTEYKNVDDVLKKRKLESLNYLQESLS